MDQAELTHAKYPGLGSQNMWPGSLLGIFAKAPYRLLKKKKKILPSTLYTSLEN